MIKGIFWAGHQYINLALVASHSFTFRYSIQLLPKRRSMRVGGLHLYQRAGANFA